MSVWLLDCLSPELLLLQFLLLWLLVIRKSNMSGWQRVGQKFSAMPARIL